MLKEVQEESRENSAVDEIIEQGNKLSLFIPWHWNMQIASRK